MTEADRIELVEQVLAGTQHELAQMTQRALEAEAKVRILSARMTTTTEQES